MKRFIPLVALLVALAACGKKEEPASQTPQAVTPAAPEAEPTSAVSAPQASSETAAPSVEPAKSSNGKYVVAQGDNLYRIAKKHGLNHRELAKWNSINNPRQLRIGQELMLTAPGK